MYSKKSVIIGPKNIYLKTTISSLFEKQAKKTPNNIAVVFENESLTYRELNQKANQLARYLKKQGVKTETLVAVCMKRCLEMVISILAILKAGGAYVPIDPNYPKNRINYMLKDSNAFILLTIKNLQFFWNKTILIDQEWEKIIKENYSNLNCSNNPRQLAYVIYTSGSTGKPKGIKISQQALSNLLFAMKDNFNLTKNDRLLALTSISFDISALEIYLPIISGATCIITPSIKQLNGIKIINYIKKYSITIMQATPAIWQLLIDSGWKHDGSIKVLCGGDKLNINLSRKLLSHKSFIWNLYGPTETTIWSSVYKLCKILKNTSKIPIGKPIANTRFYILNNFLQPTPIGIVGELYIGGIGLASGYLNNPELTKEKFIKNPFGKGKLYKTGDLVRHLEDGSLEFIGRIDRQNKIHGFRIELEEIEATLNQHPKIKQSISIIQKHNDQKRIVIYYVKKTKRKSLRQKIYKNF